MSQSEAAGHILTANASGILRVTLNRPDKKNALTIGMYSALAEVLRNAADDDAVKIVLIHGAGGNFTSGNDLSDFLNSPPHDDTSPVFQFMYTISGFEKPIVAAVEGVAVGIGTTMLLHCDLVFAARSTRFIMPFTNLGLTPEAGSSFLLPILSGYHRAAELLILGEPFTADTAHQIGLVNSVIDDGQVLDHALMQATRVASKPPISVRLTKSLLKHRYAETVRQTISEEARILIERLDSPEARAAFETFLKKK